jgi:ribosomal protein L12E/L44/L45/RPP1/RPP2
MANAISTHRPSKEDYDMLDALERALSEIDSALEDRDLEEVLLSIEERVGYTARSKVESIKNLAKRYNARLLISDRELEDIIEAEKGRGWLFRVANRIVVEHNGQRKRLLDVIREQAIKMKKAKKSRKVAEEVEDMPSIEAKIAPPEQTLERVKENARKYGAKILTPESEILKLAEKYKGKRGRWGKIIGKVMVEYQGQKMTLAELINMHRKKPKLSETEKKRRAERLKKVREEGAGKRSTYIKLGKGSPWYKYTLKSKLERGKIVSLSPEDKKVLGPIFWEIIKELYPYATSSSTITRMLSSGAGAKFAITNYPRLYSSKKAFSDTLKALTLGGAFDNEPDGWKAVAVIFRLKAKNQKELIEKLNNRMATIEERYGIRKPEISEKDKPSQLLLKVSNFYREYRKELLEQGKELIKKGDELPEEHRAIQYRKARERLSEITPPGEVKGRRVKVAEEIEELGDIEEEIAEYEREVGAEFLEVSQPVTFTQSLMNGLVIGFVSIGTLWATSKISDFLANWIGRWLKADERYIKALGDIGAGILILNSPNIWRAFMKDEMPIQGKVAALVVGWGSIANGITLAIRNERLIKVSEMVDSAIEGIGRFITNAITQKPEENETSKLQNIIQTTDDWKVSTDESIDTNTEEIYGLDLLPTKADTTEADTEYVEYNFEVEN